MTIAEMTKDTHKLNYLSEARQERVWDLRHIVDTDA